MTGVRIELDVTGLGYRERKLGALAEAGRDLPARVREHRRVSGPHHQGTVPGAKTPDGVPWAPLSESTRQRKKRHRDRILTLYGDLGGLIAFQASPNDLLVGSGLIYAGTHQFGAQKGPYGSTSKGQPIPFGDIPAREFLGLSYADREEIESTVSDY